MLNQDYNTVEVGNENAAQSTAVAAPVATGVSTAGSFASKFSQLNGAFERELGMAVLPPDAATGCTVIGGAIKFGTDMQNDAGDFLVVRPVNFTPYKKAKLGIPNPTPDEKRLQVNCYDGRTVEFDGQTYTKEDYAQMLAEKGYSKFSWDDQGVIHGVYVTCDRAGKVTVSDDDSLFAIYLSKTSRKAWDSFLVKTAMSHNSGGSLLKLSKNDRSWNGVTWTQFAFATYKDEAEAA